ncbi:MAG: MFS transporter [Legionellales bacterium]|nr:MFS transporter [Legionellales bacterium]
MKPSTSHLSTKQFIANPFRINTYLRAWLSTYLNQRLFIVFLLGFASGLPLALVGTTLQAWFAVDGVDIVTIGFLALIGQPYLFKFIWAPLMDRFSPPLLDRRSGWIFLTQIGLVICLIAIAFLTPSAQPWGLMGLALIAAFLAASQDIVIDAYRTDVLRQTERGLGAAFSVGGYRIGMIISGGIALMLADSLGWRMTYFIMAGLMSIGMVASWFAPTPENHLVPPASLHEAVVKPFVHFFQRRKAVWLLALIILYKLGEAMTSATSSVSTTFFLRELDFSLTMVGSVTKIFGMLATIVGAVVGGIVMTRLPLFHALLAFGILQAVTNLLYWLLSIVGHHVPLFIVTIFIDYGCGGMGLAALIALIMTLCDKRYSATQFALLSAIAALPRIFTGPISGFMVEQLGWSVYFLWTFVLALPALLLLWWMRRDIQQLV